MATYLLVYDIPSDSGIANPSAYLRGFAIRINLSCWIVQEEDIPYAYFHEIATQGAKWRAVKFDASEATNLMELAVMNLKSEIAEMRVNTRESCERASARMEREGGEAGLKAIQKQRGTVAQRLSAFRKNLNAMKRAAARFGIQAEQIGLGEALAYISTLHGIMNRRAETYARATNLAAQMGGDAAALARAARSGRNVPAGFIADAMEESGQSTEESRIVAERLRNIFRGVSSHGG